MLFQVYSIFDDAVKTFFPPLYFRNKGEALRWFADTVNDPQSKLAKHPGDYTLFEVGSFNDENCKFVLHATPSRMGLALEFIKGSVSGGAGGSPPVEA